jgi:hypothetical protein
MPTLEERVQALEQENAARKKAEELLTITVRALVSKEAFEKLLEAVEKLQETVEKNQEQNGKIFDVLNTHNVFTNERLTDLQDQIIALDGKTVGLQTEMRQRFTELDGKIVGQQTETRQRLTEQDGKVTSLQTEMRQRFTGIETALTQILERLPEKP